MGGGGQISPSPIDFHRRPYNTLALPCERVINNGMRCHLTPLIDVSIRCPTRPVQSVNCSFTCQVRNFLSTILFRQYWCLMVTHYKGHFALLDLPSRDWYDAHVCYRGLRGHVSSTVSLTTLTPTAPGIYPQLTTVTENVKD